MIAISPELHARAVHCVTSYDPENPDTALSAWLVLKRVKGAPIDAARMSRLRPRHDVAPIYRAPVLPVWPEGAA